MAENPGGSEVHLPDHNPERDALPETGTPAGTVWRGSNVPVPGSRSGGATGYERGNGDASKPGRIEQPAPAAASSPRPLSEGEREALQGAWDGAAQLPGDLSQESDYEETRDAAAGGEQETESERRLRHLSGDPESREGAEPSPGGPS